VVATIEALVSDAEPGQASPAAAGPHLERLRERGLV
jgi:hypothetical protein